MFSVDIDVSDIIAYRSSQLQVVVTLDALLGDSLSNAFRMTTFELT